MKRIALAATLWTLAACGRPADPPPPPANPGPPLPALPELKPSTDFAQDGLMELPDAPASFGWDLREDVHHFYRYEQESHLVMTVTGGTESGKIASRTQWRGDGEVIGGGSGRGELTFLASPIGQWNNEQPLPSEELNKVPKILVRYQLLENGRFEIPQILSGQEDPLLDVFLAMPSRELKVGEKEARDVHIAHLQESLKYHGRQEITNAGRRKVGRHECVKLMSRVDFEAVPPGDGHGRLVGSIAAYFDPKEKRMVRVDGALVMAVDVRREVKPADPKVAPFWQMNRVQADMRVTITLKD